MILVGTYENVDFSKIVLVDGTVIRPTQDAYLATADVYEAHATDSDENSYLIKWNVARHDVEHDEACDWGNFKIFRI